MWAGVKTPAGCEPLLAKGGAHHDQSCCHRVLSCTRILCVSVANARRRRMPLALTTSSCDENYSVLVPLPRMARSPSPSLSCVVSLSYRMAVHAISGWLSRLAVDAPDVSAVLQKIESVRTPGCGGVGPQYDHGRPWGGHSPTSPLCLQFVRHSPGPVADHQPALQCTIPFCASKSSGDRTAALRLCRALITASADPGGVVTQLFADKVRRRCPRIVLYTTCVVTCSGRRCWSCGAWSGNPASTARRGPRRPSWCSVSSM